MKRTLLSALLAGGVLAGGIASAQAPATAPAPASTSAPVITNPTDRTVAPVKAGEPATVVSPEQAPAPGPVAPPVATPEQQAALAGARTAPPEPLPTPPSAAGSLLQTVVALAFVLAILVGLAWALKRFGPRNVTGGSTVKLVGALSVGARERILVVEVGDQWIVVGASPGRMNALATMPRQEGNAGGQADLARQQALPATNFSEWFKQTIEKRNGK
ncbi:flagellar biosynthetic protein FliO [Pseudoduganella sp. SL102]|uniref:flagellar biosynthetic protein FliO n=1 Tax=Pseudoduganella sp. SL102 TaxID=2995154 RepID=UPI00248AF11F|nr:flagellar biosynthetic protein FliO [Pseudoduganella sp. SL102]WBS01774.1 flagellar biosynthetic protein FliO [Pseudoduganella sp. SL102]